MNAKIVSRNKTIDLLIKDRYSLRDLKEIEHFFKVNETLKFIAKKNGLYAALTSDYTESKSGYTYTWIRDTIMVTNYQREVKHYQNASNTMLALRDYFFKYSFRFKNIIEGKADMNNPMQRPHVRFNGDTLEEISQQWAHAQNDALGYALWMTFKLCNMNEYSLTPTDCQVWSLFPFYFEAIEFWQDSDSGHWEETRKVASSSIGVVTAALQEMRQYMMGNPGMCFTCDGMSVSTQQLDDLISKGKAQLDMLLPYESPPYRKADGALLFLIYPLNIANSRQSQEILDIVLHDLKGRYGIKRYIGDSYWCAEYKKMLKEDERTVDFSTNIGPRDGMLKPGEEAQWCIFDPIVSVIYGQKYLIDRNPKHLDLQIEYFNRSLSQITAEEFHLGGGKCPEAYYIEDSGKGKYVPNDHVPLAWTQANLGTALEYMRRSLNP